MKTFILQVFFISAFAFTSLSLSAQLSIEMKIGVSGDDVIILWFAKNQADVELYELDRSPDGRNWELVHQESGTATPTGNYAFDDLDLANGEYAYRLRVTYANGEEEIIGHELVMVNVSPVFTNTSLFPDEVRFDPVFE